MTMEPTIPDDTPQQQQQQQETKQQKHDKNKEQEKDDDSQSHHDKSRQYLNSSLSALRSCLRRPTTVTNTTANPTVIVMPPTTDDDDDDDDLRDTITTTPSTPSSSDDDDDESSSLLRLSSSQNNEKSTKNNRHLKKLLSLSSYKKRLRTFTPNMYFGKPMALSPLIAARCGWTNTSINTLTCPHCSATLTIKLFHPQLGRDGTKTLCRYYQRKLLTSHEDSCPFSFLARRYDDEEEVGGGREWVWSEDSKTQNGVRLMARSFDGWRSRRMMVVVPPLLDEMLRRNDGGVGEGLSLLKRLYNVVTTDEEEEGGRPLSEDGVLLSLLGWSPVPSSSTSGENDETACRSIMVECRVCLARASVPFTIESDDDAGVQGIETTTTTTMEENYNNDEAKRPKTKRRRINTSGMNPLTCHRSYCPYITTRSISDCFESPSSEDDVGWMTVAKQLIQQTVSLRGVVAHDGDDKLRVTTGEETLAVVKSVFNSCLGTTTGMAVKGKKTATTMVGRRG